VTGRVAICTAVAMTDQIDSLLTRYPAVERGLGGVGKKLGYAGYCAALGAGLFKEVQHLLPPMDTSPAQVKQQQGEVCLKISIGEIIEWAGSPDQDIAEYRK